MESDPDYDELDEFERFTEIPQFGDPFDMPDDPVKTHVDLKLKADDVTVGVIRVDKRMLKAFQGEHSLTDILYDPDIMRTARIMESNHPELMVADHTYDTITKWVNASVPGIYYDKDPKEHPKESLELEGSVRLKSQASKSSGEPPAKSALFTIFKTVRPDPKLKISVELEEKPKTYPRAVTPSDVRSLTKRGYFLKEKVGQGTFSTVWRTEFTNVKPGDKPLILACKLMNRQTLSAHARNFSDREVDIVARLCHNNIIMHHSIVERKEKLFVFMRYAEGGDVETYLAKNGYLKEPQTREWMRQIASAVQYLHVRGVAHRDLKCGNILITEKSNLKLSDFGFSRFSMDRFGKRMLSETWCGSPVYSAPEIILGEPYDPFIADCWSMGVCMYALLTASLPYSGAVSLNKLLQSQYEQQWSIHPDIMKDLSAECLRVLQRLMQPDLKYRMTATGLLNCPWFKDPFARGIPKIIAHFDLPTLFNKKKLRSYASANRFRCPKRLVVLSNRDCIQHLGLAEVIDHLSLTSANETKMDELSNKRDRISMDDGDGPGDKGDPRIEVARISGKVDDQQGENVKDEAHEGRNRTRRHDLDLNKMAQDLEIQLGGSNETSQEVQARLSAKQGGFAEGRAKSGAIGTATASGAGSKGNSRKTRGSITCPAGPNTLFNIGGVEIPIPGLRPSKVGTDVNAQWGAKCNTAGPSYSDLVGTSDYNLLMVLVPILAVTALLLLVACAICMYLTRGRKEPPPSPTAASYSAPPPPTTVYVTQPAPQSHQAMGIREMRPSYTTAPFGNVVASNLPYVVQTQPVMQQSRQPSVMLAGPPMGGGPREGSLMYVRPPYNQGPRGYQFAVDRPMDHNRPLEVIHLRSTEEE